MRTWRGVEQGGYRLEYADKPSKGETALRSSGGAAIEMWYSLGIRVGADGTIADVRWDGPADKAKLAPGQKIYAVNGEVYSGDQVDRRRSGRRKGRRSRFT